MRILLQDGLTYYQGAFKPMDIAIEAGVLREIAPRISPFNFDLIFQLNNRHIVPGFADVHVHLREPGFSYKETIASGTAAAARGGYTLVCPMPNLQPVPDTPEHLAEELALIERDALVRVVPYGAITVEEMGRRLVDYAALAPQVAAFSDDGKGVQSEELMLEAMLRIKAAGKGIAAHCEDENLLFGGYIHDGRYAKAHGHKGICPESEWLPIKRDIQMVRQTGCPYHICHVSAKESVELIRQAKQEGLPVTCETAPHYLVLCEDDLQEDGRFKMNPPLRSREDQEALLEALTDGTIDAIATDHAPHTAEEKSRGLAGSAMGIVGLETAFPVLFTHLVKTGRLSLEELLALLTTKPRRIFGLPGGGIKIGGKADLTVLDLNDSYQIDPGSFLSKGRSTPFAGMKVWGQVLLTIAEGRIAWQKEGLA